MEGASHLKNGTAFSFQPPGCEVGATCTAIRALVLSLSNVNPIPDGAVLYSCDVTTGETPGVFPLTCLNEGASDPAGRSLPTRCDDGQVVVAFSQPTDTPTVVVTNTPTATNTPLAPPPTDTGTPVMPGPPSECDDGCAIASQAEATTSWLLVPPAALLIWLRRRTSGWEGRLCPARRWPDAGESETRPYGIGVGSCQLPVQSPNRMAMKSWPGAGGTSGE
jgi:hypothetical protein